MVRAVFGSINLRTSLACRATCLGPFWQITTQTVRVKQAIRTTHLYSKIQGASTRVPPVMWPFHVPLAQNDPLYGRSRTEFLTKNKDLLATTGSVASRPIQSTTA